MRKAVKIISSILILASVMLATTACSSQEAYLGYWKCNTKEHPDCGFTLHILQDEKTSTVYVHTVVHTPGLPSIFVSFDGLNYYENSYHKDGGGATYKVSGNTLTLTLEDGNKSTYKRLDGEPEDFPPLPSPDEL